ncbi:substrate-binding domain-containing protein [Acidovorax sp. Leaf78]|uniref:substrate-binding domain-containing protein n=1 Tax=Acidovorax sp. Leaf78 TaxID=1736237 RepID=UPI000A9585E3
MKKTAPHARHPVPSLSPEGSAFSSRGGPAVQSFRLLGPVPRIQQALVAIIFVASGVASAQSITMASTTSTEQSGLFGHLLPEFKKTSGIDLKVVALGTGQALDMARRGDADVLFVHDQAAEEKFVADGWGVKRYPVMYNDFILVGPKDDPAGTRGKDIVQALQKLAAGNGNFVSRGDKSGTHAAELRYWKLAGADAAKGSGYKECGCGMGPALNIAASSNAYVLADRGTWLNFKNRADLAVLVEGDTQLFNQYGVMVVNPAKHPHVKAQDAQKFVDWVVSPAGQQVIASYKIGGEQLFFPNAGK